MIEIYFKTVRDAEFKKIEDFRSGSWIYVKNAGPDDLQKISEVTQIEMADLKDSLDKYELPRIEHFNENMLFFIRHPSEKEAGLYTETLTMVLTPAYVIAISPSRSEIIEQLLTSSTSLGTTQKAKLILNIFLKITQEFTSGIKKLRHAVLGFDETPSILDSNAIIVLTKNEEILNQYLTALVPIRNLLETLAGGRFINFYEKDLDLLEDLMIAIRQSEDICRVNIKSIRSLRDSYHIIFTNDVNRTIKLLTSLTIIFSIPTIIASIYGMNVALPFQNKGFAFALIISFTIVSSILALIWFRAKRWL